MFSRLVLLAASLLLLEGCCVREFSGGTGNYGSSAGTTGSSSGTTGGNGTSGGICAGSANGLQPELTYPFERISSMASVDLDGDGLLDLVATESASSSFSGFEVLFADSDGGLAFPVSHELISSAYHALATGDLNGDGRPDLAISDGYLILTFINRGDGTLEQGASLDASELVESIAVADFDGNGFADLLITYWGGTEEVAEVCLGEASGSFQAPVALTEVGGPEWIKPLVGDLNQDGLPDIAAATVDGGSLVVLLNQGDGGFRSTVYATPVLGPLALFPRSDAGAPDLLLGAPAAFLDDGGEALGSIRVLRNAGDGTFSLGPTGSIPGGAALAVADFNGDCVPDVATPFLGLADAGILVLYGLANGGFDTPVLLPFPTNAPYALAVLGSFGHPTALAADDYWSPGLTVYGDPRGQ